MFVTCVMFLFVDHVGWSTRGPRRGPRGGQEGHRRATEGSERGSGGPQEGHRGSQHGSHRYSCVNVMKCGVFHVRLLVYWFFNLPTCVFMSFTHQCMVGWFIMVTGGPQEGWSMRDNLMIGVRVGHRGVQTGSNSGSYGHHWSSRTSIHGTDVQSIITLFRSLILPYIHPWMVVTDCYIIDPPVHVYHWSSRTTVSLIFQSSVSWLFQPTMYTSLILLYKCLTDVPI